MPQWLFKVETFCCLRTYVLLIGKILSVISKLQKLLYYPPQLKSVTPFMRTGRAYDTEVNIDCS